MSFGRHVSLSLTLAVALAGCSVPFAGVYPQLGLTQPAATPAPGGGAAVPAPAGATRLNGDVFFNDTTVANARLSAFDLATGKPLELISAGGQNLRAYALRQTNPPQTDAQGRFDYQIAPLRPEQVIKLQAISGSQVFVTLFDARGQAIGSAPQAYQLRQTGSDIQNIRLRLTLATTAVAKAFEGAIKLQFRRPAAERAGALNALIARMQTLTAEVETAIAKNPTVAARLLDSLNPDADVANAEAFRSVLRELGVFDTLFKAVQQTLVELTATALGDSQALDAIIAENFPLDTVTIGNNGAITFTGPTGPVTLNVTPPASGQPVPAPTSTPGSGSGGSGSSGQTQSQALPNPRGMADVPVIVVDANRFQGPPPAFRILAKGTSLRAVVRTDSQGSYRLSGIAAGDYFIIPRPTNGTTDARPRFVSFKLGSVSGVDFAVLVPRVTYQLNQSQLDIPPLPVGADFESTAPMSTLLPGLSSISGTVRGLYL